MSLINKVLRDLDQRQAVGDGPPPSTVRTVGARREGHEWFWRTVAFLVLLALGWVAWVVYQIQPRPLATELAQEAAVKRAAPAVAQAPAVVQPPAPAVVPQAVVLPPVSPAAQKPAIEPSTAAKPAPPTTTQTPATKPAPLHFDVIVFTSYTDFSEGSMFFK